MFQILLRAQYLEEENAKLREELQVQTTEKEDMKTAILQLNQRLLQNPPVISEVKSVQLLSIALLQQLLLDKRRHQILNFKN